LTAKVGRLAVEAGVSLVGFAELGGLADRPRAVVIAIRHSPEVLADPTNMPNPAYSDEYWRLNERLAEIAAAIATLLQQAGFRAYANAPTRHQIDPETLATSFPHKTAATRAGLGWIGKSALLVTPELGPALRLNTVLTDAPIIAGMPVTASECGDCSVCVESCPARAITGAEWFPGRPREELLDAHACNSTCSERSRRIGIEGGRCGVCMAVCPRRPRN